MQALVLARISLRSESEMACQTTYAVAWLRLSNTQVWWRQSELLVWKMCHRQGEMGSGNSAMYYARIAYSEWRLALAAVSGHQQPCSLTLQLDCDLATNRSMGCRLLSVAGGVTLYLPYSGLLFFSLNHWWPAMMQHNNKDVRFERKKEQRHVRLKNARKMSQHYYFTLFIICRYCYSFD